MKCIKKMGNGACSNKMCKQCCINHSTVVCVTHAVKANAATRMAAKPGAELCRQKSKEVDSEGGDVVATASTKVGNIAMPGHTGTIDPLNNDMCEVTATMVQLCKRKVRASETEVPASEMNVEDACMF